MAKERQTLTWEGNNEEVRRLFTLTPDDLYFLRLSNVNYLGPPYGNYFCRFLRLDLRRFLLKLAVMVGFGSTIALDLHQIQNDGVMDDAIYCRHRGHRVFENLVPLAKDQMRGKDH